MNIEEICFQMLHFIEVRNAYRSFTLGSCNFSFFL